MHFRPHTDMIESGDLMHKLADVLFTIYAPRWEKKRQEMSAAESDPSTNLEEVLCLFEKLQFGLDVNVKFSGTREFEYTRELEIFDVFNVALYHGWLIDPQQHELYENFADKSYNQLVDTSLADATETSETEPASENASSNEPCSSKKPDKTYLSLLAQSFLDETASQLTYYGLCELHANLKPNELAILFRNNHFSVLYKNAADEKLYLLVTDQGYLSHKEVVWETLENIDGNGRFCSLNADFVVPQGDEQDNE